MQPKPSIMSLIRRRKSWRTFRNRPLPAALQERVRQVLADGFPSPFPGRCRFHLKEPVKFRAGKPSVIGTYGTVSGARQFVVGAAAAGPFDLVNYGFLLERIILELTALGLGTCWLGATFRHEDFAALIGAAEDEQVPAVTPVGEILEHRGLNDHIMNWYATAHVRKPWQELFFHGAFGRTLTPAAAGLHAEALEMVRLAPSASNRQPWRVVRDNARDSFHFYLRRNPIYIGLIHTAFQAHDLQQLDLGIAMCHFELTARELGLPGRWVAADPCLSPVPKLTDYFVSWIGE